MATEKNNKLTGKDLVTVGIYTALYFVVGMGSGFLGFFPIFIPLLTVIVPVLGGIPFMLFASKVKKFGMITLLSAINGICMFAAGMGPYVAGTGIVFGLLADLLIKSGEYKSAKKTRRSERPEQNEQTESAGTQNDAVESEGSASADGQTSNGDESAPAAETEQAD